MRTIHRGSKRNMASYKVKALSDRKFAYQLGREAKLGWISQLRQAFSQETPEEWMPAQYQSVFKEGIN